MSDKRPFAISRNGVTIECAQGDITRQDDMDAIVNAANAQLATGGGVAGAIHRAAGPALYEECRPLAPIKPGQAVITGAHNLPNRHVIHCLGPVYGTDEPSDRLLADCYRNALSLADEAGLNSIAFPSISTGAFGYPMKDAAGVAFATLLDSLPRLSSLKTIRLVLFSESDCDRHREVLREMA
ncbi:macro domain-containing protein [Marinimicrobium sp. C2-29]|uniref:macro domain-containing protein n=1 Tax=Marinimicrobium sp. C2-29 TaxID=3139825 RepID=UPI0031398F0B